ncbi:MAG: molybdopterin-dependent oxidoreductase [Deltaproteobacteria bacterium]|jgi:anaerobic selenocysteine-containing dehydrogenase|nr:molybdopterin-dependent oxidoreductase [Deltaproteobacteria bacterium]
MVEEIRTVCNRDCPDSCSIVATVKNGKIVKHKGDPKHGVTRGFLCYRGNHYLDRLYSDDRILHPLRRTGKGWERISWDDALDLMTEKLCHFRKQYGAHSVTYISYSGIRGQVAQVMARTFWDHFGGVTQMRGGLSVEACYEAQVSDFGDECTPTPEDLANSDAFIIWGKNVAITRVHCWPFIKAARKRGAPLVVIDPVRCRTAERADLHLALKPGSDGMLAIGIARILLKKEQFDKAFVEKHCANFLAYRKLILSISMQDVINATGISLENIEKVAALYLSKKPLATLIGLGPSYWKQGVESVRLIDALAAMTGNIGISGGAVHTDINGGAGLDHSILTPPLKNEHRSIMLPKLGDEILSTTNPQIKMGIVAGANPAATCPDTGRVLEALNSLEFLVVIDHFKTATAEAADLFLPCTTYLEMDDLVTAYGHHWLSLSQAVIPPLGEAKSDVSIYKALAERLGFGEALTGEPSEWIDRMLAPLNKQGINREALITQPMLNPAHNPIPFVDRKFRTPSGKFEFITEFDHKTIVGPSDNQLYFIATKTLKMVNAQINTEDLPSEPRVKAHPDTIFRFGLKSGDLIVVESNVGSVIAIIDADDDIHPEVLLFNPATWKGDLQGVNQLRESHISDIGEAAAMHETLVTLYKCPSAQSV